MFTNYFQVQTKSISPFRPYPNFCWAVSDLKWDSEGSDIINMIRIPSNILFIITICITVPTLFLGRHMAWRPNNPLIAYKDDKDEVFTLLFFFRIFFVGFFASFFLHIFSCVFFSYFFWGPFLHHVYLQVFFMKFWAVN